MNLQKPKTKKTIKAQAMVEFMLALPVLIVLLYGIIELSRLIFIFASVANASRQAARYGAGSGEENGVNFYQDCDGIKETANRSAILTTFTDINITYDRGLTSEGDQIPITDIDPSPDSDMCPIEDNLLRNGDRIIVQVKADYEPILGFLPIDPMEIVSANARTFLISVPIYGSAQPTGFSAETSTPSKVPTNTEMPRTPTQPPANTPTQHNVPGGTSVAVFYTPTQSLPPTATFTPSNTPLPSLTPSITPTAISCTGLTGVAHGKLVFKNDYMEMTIFNNTGHVLDVAQVYVEWNHDTGHDGSDSTLRLQQIQLAAQNWNGDILAPSAFINPFYPTIPQGESVVRFIFHQKYDRLDGTERIIITIGTPGCVNYPIDSSK
ncbi:MAG TPA: TadE/TadG family type IV pilus assembly protein [Anaerolineales bacterium]|nr:TadE/TadG family type IV pilus assembly protein [Anaerolineales bacterium]